jgi:hypothetical protein
MNKLQRDCILLVFNVNCDITYILKKLIVRNDLLHWTCTSGLFLKEHVLPSLCSHNCSALKQHHPWYAISPLIKIKGCQVWWTGWPDDHEHSKNLHPYSFILFTQNRHMKKQQKLDRCSIGHLLACIFCMIGQWVKWALKLIKMRKITHGNTRVTELSYTKFNKNLPKKLKLFT